MSRSKTDVARTSTCGVLAIAFALMVLLPQPAQAAYAIAFNVSTGRAAANNASFDIAAVKRNALSACGAGCRIVTSGKKNCAAVIEAVSTGTRAWAVATGTTRAAAINAATHDCRRKGGVTCKPATAICD